jgi:hypothetical protein
VNKNVKNCRWRSQRETWFAYDLISGRSVFSSAGYCQRSRWVHCIRRCSFTGLTGFPEKISRWISFTCKSLTTVNDIFSSRLIFLADNFRIFGSISMKRKPFYGRWTVLQLCFWLRSDWMMCLVAIWWKTNLSTAGAIFDLVVFGRFGAKGLVTSNRSQKISDRALQELSNGILTCSFGWKLSHWKGSSVVTFSLVNEIICVKRPFNISF